MMSALETNFGQTPSQTVGPYFAYGLTATQYGYDFDQPFDAVLALRRRHGRAHPARRPVLDGDGTPIGDAMIEISQADGNGAISEVGRRRAGHRLSCLRPRRHRHRCAEPLRVPDRQARRRGRQARRRTSTSSC